MNIGSMTLKMAKFLQCAFPIRLLGCLIPLLLPRREQIKLEKAAFYLKI
jgi:hypothetical protein